MSVRNTVKSIQDIMRQDSGVDGDAQRISQLCWMFFLKIIDDQDQQLELMQDDYKSPIPKPLQWRSWAADPEGITGEELLTFANAELFPKLKELSVGGKQGDRKRVVRDVFEDAYNYMKSGQLMRQVINKINEVDFNNLAERQHFGDIYEQILTDLQSAGNAGEYYTPRAVTAFMVDRIDPRPGELLLDPACGTGGFLTCALRHMRDRYVKTTKNEQIMQDARVSIEVSHLRTPTLNERRNVPPLSSLLCRSVFESLSSSTAREFAESSVAITANSSPPTRAIISVFLKHSRSTAATVRSAKSPSLWP